ncbi:hypothetical protein KIW84_070864 [Lathyrus oleraceus]|uniref:Uncharacterized protein n=1 Tax=Pisum sativum TaxID=3888 RepID=A0A9D4VIM5_PEA|nr:hypothetical protein KIW84_070864 [Pisum sativum]
MCGQRSRKLTSGDKDCPRSGQVILINPSSKLLFNGLFFLPVNLIVKRLFFPGESKTSCRASLAASSIVVEELMSIECGDSSFIALLPSGFLILPDGHSNSNNIVGGSSDGSGNFGGENDNNRRLLM